MRALGASLGLPTRAGRGLWLHRGFCGFTQGSVVSRRDLWLHVRDSDFIQGAGELDVSAWGQRIVHCREDQVTGMKEPHGFLGLGNPAAGTGWVGSCWGAHGLAARKPVALLMAFVISDGQQ